MTKKTQAVLVVAALLGAGFGAPTFAQGVLLPYRVQSVTAVSLGTLGGPTSEALDINNSGEIVGWSTTASGVERAFLVLNGFMVDIGYGPSTATSRATGINNNHKVVGHEYSGVGLYLKPFYWDLSSGWKVMSHIVFPGSGWDDVYVVIPNAINDQGRIVGGADGVFSPYAPGLPPFDGCHELLSVQWQDKNSNPERLFCNPGTHPNFGATDINNSGEIVGYDQYWNHHGYVFKDGIKIDVPPLPGGSETMIQGINESGNVVGSDNWQDHAIFWDRITANSIDLGHLPSGDRAQAFEINDSNFVAGVSDTRVWVGRTWVRVNRGFIWHKDFGMVGLPLPSIYFPGTTNCAANSINNRINATGLVQLVGYCEKDGNKQAVRWNVIVTREPDAGLVGTL